MFHGGGCIECAAIGFDDAPITHAAHRCAAMITVSHQTRAQAIPAEHLQCPFTAKLPSRPSTESGHSERGTVEVKTTNV